MRRVLVWLQNHRQQTGIFAIAALVALTIGLGIGGRQTIYAQLNDWKLIPRPERLTELYFSDHRSLPMTYSSDQQQAVSFTVRNLEHRTTAYTYTVTQDSEEPKTIALAATGSFRLDHGQTKQLSLPFTPAAQGPRSRVTVTISYQGIAFGQDQPSTQNQSIYYWMTEQGAAQ